MQGDAGLIPGLGRSPEERNGNPLQYSCLGNPMDRGPLEAMVHGVSESDMTECAHTHTHTHLYTCARHCVDTKNKIVSIFVEFSL